MQIIAWLRAFLDPRKHVTVAWDRWGRAHQAKCRFCGRVIKVTEHGRIYKHGRKKWACPGTNGRVTRPRVRASVAGQTTNATSRR